MTYDSPDCQVRLTLVPQRRGQLIRCAISVEEERLLRSGLEVFNEISLEGYPAVGFGAGTRRATFDFNWVHPTGADWRISGQRVQGLIERLAGMLGDAPTPARRGARPRRLAELLPAAFGRVATAA